jgi:competence protein ComGF
LLTKDGIYYGNPHYYITSKASFSYISSLSFMGCDHKPFSTVEWQMFVKDVSSSLKCTNIHAYIHNFAKISSKELNTNTIIGSSVSL